MKNQETELDKAINLVNKRGFMVVPPFSLSAKPYIQELSDLVECAGYRLDEAKIERDGNKATGRILLAVFPFKALEMKEHEGKA
jgi:hypothetical protein